MFFLEGAAMHTVISITLLLAAAFSIPFIGRLMFHISRAVLILFGSVFIVLITVILLG